MLTTQNFKRAQKHAKILGTKVGDASRPSNLKELHPSLDHQSRDFILIETDLVIERS